MPIVPRVTTTQVQQAGLPNARERVETSAEAFGGGQSLAAVGQAAQGLLGSTQRLVLEEKAKADDSWSKDAFAKAARARQEALYNPQNGALIRRGKDAFDVADQYGGAYDKTLDEIESTATNDAQRGMFKQIRNQQKLDLMGDLERHTLGETKRYQEETNRSALEVAKDDAVLNYQNPERVSASLALQKSLILSHARDNGQDAATAQDEYQKVTSQTHAAIIDRMLSNGQDLLAKKYYDANKAGLTHGVAHVEKALEEGTLRGESQRQSDTIISESSGMGDALSKTRQIEDPKVRDAATDRVKQYYSAQKAAEAERTERIMTQAGNIIDKTGSVDQVPPGQWATLSPSEKSSLKAYAKHRQEGTQPETDWKKYYDVKTLASTPVGKDEFMKMNLMELRPHMDDSRFKELVDIQTSLRKNDGKAEKTLDGYRTNQQIVNDSLLAAGYRVNPKPGTTDAEKDALFKSKVDEQMRVLQAQTGKAANNEDVQNIVDNLLIKSTNDGFLSFLGIGRGKRAFEMNADERANRDVNPKDIPALDRKKIEEALKRRNIPATDDRIKELYNRKYSQVTRGQ